MLGSVFQSESCSVLVTEEDPVIVTSDHITSVIKAAQKAPNGRARLILHDGREDTLHEMVIALPPNSCDHPHINFRSGKSFVALSGRFAVLRFSDNGETVEPIVLSAGAWSGGCMVRLRAAAWHTIIPLDGDVVFLETITGPFVGNRFAEWFPQKEQEEKYNIAANKLRQLARESANMVDKNIHNRAFIIQ